MCHALAVNWVLEKRSRSEQLGDVGDVDELKIDDDDDEGTVMPKSEAWIGLNRFFVIGLGVVVGSGCVLGNKFPRFLKSSHNCGT